MPETHLKNKISGQCQSIHFYIYCCCRLNSLFIENNMRIESNSDGSNLMSGTKNLIFLFQYIFMIESVLKLCHNRFLTIKKFICILLSSFQIMHFSKKNLTLQSRFLAMLNIVNFSCETQANLLIRKNYKEME